MTRLVPYITMLLAMSAAQAEEGLSARDAFRKGVAHMGGRSLEQEPANWEKAAAYLRKAKALPFTKNDMNWGDEEPSVTPTYEYAKAMFTWKVRGNLIHCLCRLGKGGEEEINQLLEEPMHWPPQYPHREVVIPGIPQYLGTAEAASGGRAVARWFETNEARLEKNRHYWLQRGYYYQGRRERQAEEQAWKAGFERARRDPVYDRNSPEGDTTRAITLSYLRLLSDSKRREEAIGLAAEMMAENDCNSIIAMTAAEDMVRLLSGRFLPIDPRLWDWLKKRERWERPEEKILQKIFSASRGKAVAENRNRAEALAKTSPAGRALVMGKVLLAHKYPEHAAMFFRERMKYPVESYEEHRLTSLLDDALKNQ